MVDTTETTPVSAPQPSPTTSAAWLNAIQPLVEQLELPSEVVTNALISAKLVKAANDKGAAALVDADAITDADFTRAFPDATSGDLRLAVKKLRAAAAPKPEPTQVLSAAPANSMAAILPQPPDDDSLLEALKVGGVAKVGETEVTAAVRVLLADRLALDGIERRVADAIERRATDLGEPVPEIFYELETLIGRRSYAEVLRAMGMPGSLVSAARKKELLNRISGIFTLLQGFQDRLTGWQENWTSRMSNPGALFAGLAVVMGGGGANPAAATLMEAPDPNPILDAAAGVIDQLNAMFAGTGIPVARALAADAIATRRFLENPALVSAVGAGSRDEMLKTLGLGVSADLVRAERDVTQYILCVMRIQKLTTQQLPGFIIAVQQLGSQLPWAQLTGTARTTTTNGRNGSGRGEPIPGSRDPERVRSGALPLDDNGGSTSRYR